MKNRDNTANYQSHWRLLTRAFSLVAFLLLCAGLSTGFAANFIANPGFETGTDGLNNDLACAPPWSGWEGTWTAGANPLLDAANGSARSWYNYGGSRNLAAANDMNLFLDRTGTFTYTISAQFYVPSVPAGVKACAMIRLHCLAGTDFPAGDPILLDDSLPEGELVVGAWNTKTVVVTGLPNKFAGCGFVQYASFRVYGRNVSDNARTTVAPDAYIDNCQFSSGNYTGVINGVVKNASGTLAGAAVKLSYKGTDVNTITTTGDGVFNFADLLPGESYSVTITKTAYLAASRTATASTNLGDVILSPDPDFDPTAVVSLRAASLAVGTNLASWINGGNLGGSFDKFSGGTGPEVKYVLGKKAVEFVQTDSAVNRRTMAAATPTPASLTGNSPWTISALIYRNDATVNSENCFFEWAGRSWADGQTAQFCYRNNLAFVHFGGGFDSGFTTVPSSGAWHYMTVTYDGTIETIYIDGMVDKTIDRSAAPLNLVANGLLIVGGATWHDVRGEDQYWRFNGAINTLKIYDRALTATEVAALTTTVKKTITVSVGANGSITPGPGAVQVDEGDSPTFTITPALGYKIQDVLVDGVSNPGAVAAGSYTFNNVTTAHSISATFEALPPQLVSGKITDGTLGVAGATVYFKLSPTAYSSPLFTTTTDGSGNYSISLAPANWYASAGANGYDFSADSTFTVSSSPVTIPNIVLTANPNWDVLFSLTVDGLTSIPDGTVTGNRNTSYPSAGVLAAMGTPTATTVDGVKWASNDRDDSVPNNNDGYELTGVSFLGGTVANGASIVAVAQPRYTLIGGEARGEIVSLYYNGLNLCVDHATGEVMIARKAWDFRRTGVILPDGQKTILSLIAELDGSCKLYVNGREAWTAASLGANYFARLEGTDMNWMTRIGVGRNPWDSWSSFNGNVGDVYVYKRAIPEANRTALENSLGAKFGIAIPVFVPISGKVTLPDGTTPVAGATVTATGPETFTAITGADGTYSVTVQGGASAVNYSVAATKPSYSTSTPQSVNVTTSGVLGLNLQISLITAIQGIVKQADGTPIPNAVVQIGDAGPAAVTGADGKYVVTSITTGPGTSFYADALGFADYNETIDTSAAASSVITKGDVVLTPKVEADYTYIQNGGFEKGLAPWIRNYGTPEVGVTTDAAASGTHAGYWKSTVAAFHEGYLAQKIPVIEGSTYNIYFKLKTSAAVGQCGFDFLNEAGDSIAWWGYNGGLRPNENWMYNTVPNVWEQALNYRNWNDTDHLTCVRVTPQVGTVSIQLVMGLGANAVGQVLYVDDVVVDRVGPAAPPLTPTIAVPPSGIPTFKFQTLTGHSYRMVYKNALTDANWSTNASMLWIPGTGSEVEATDSSSPLPAARYYRLEIQ